VNDLARPGGMKASFIIMRGWWLMGKSKVKVEDMSKSEKRFMLSDVKNGRLHKQK
jgi:hypothetical protein